MCKQVREKKSGDEIMTFNDMLLSVLAFNVITEKDPNEEKGKKGSLFFTGLCLVTAGILLLFMVLLKLGITSDQLLKAVMIVLTPFLWDYFINFTVMDLTNTQHIFAAAGTIMASYIVLIVLEAISKAQRLLTASTIVSIQSFGYLVGKVLAAVKWIVQAVLICSIFKGLIHLVFGFFIWLF
jgi:hypothetical protein